MVKSLLPSYRLTQSSLDTLADAITKGSAFAPQVAAECLCRLQPLSAGVLPDQALSSFIPLKKMFLPPREKLWSFQSGQFSALEQPEPFAVVGVPLCDLQALWYLDQVFAEDLPYQKRRTRSLVAAMPCALRSHARMSVRSSVDAGCRRSVSGAKTRLGPFPCRRRSLAVLRRRRRCGQAPAVAYD
jgi:hypothetical protein